MVKKVALPALTFPINVEDYLWVDSKIMGIDPTILARTDWNWHFGIWNYPHIYR